MDNEEVASAEPEVADLLSDSDSSIKLGDWEGKAGDFRKHWIPQSELKGMRDKDKEEIARQVATQVDAQQATWLAQKSAEAMARQAQAAPQQTQPQGTTFQGKLDAIYATANAEHGGYMHINQSQERDKLLLEAVQAEFATRDRMTNHLGTRLDEWYKDSQQRAGTLQTLAGDHSEKVWGKLIDKLEKDNPTLPRTMIEALASGYQPSENETADQLRTGIGNSITEHVQSMSAHDVAARATKREQAEKLSRVGMAGTAAAAVPGKPGKPLTTPDEIADHYFQSEPA